jgi:hypothetical protein
VVPVGFHDFFAGCATIAGALIGLLFVALSVTSEYLSGANARTDHQVRAGAAFSALVNTLVIALFALLPGADLGTVGLVLAAVGLGTTAALVFALAREDGRIGRADLFMFLVLLALYGGQLANSVRLEQVPHQAGLVVNQGELAIAFFLFSIARSWQLVGAREFGLVTALASVLHRPGDNGPRPPDGDRPADKGPHPPAGDRPTAAAPPAAAAPAAEDPGTGRAPA